LHLGSFFQQKTENSLIKEMSNALTSLLTYHNEMRSLEERMAGYLPRQD